MAYVQGMPPTSVDNPISRWANVHQAVRFIMMSPKQWARKSNTGCTSHTYEMDRLEIRIER